MLLVGVVMFAIAYLGFATNSTNIWFLLAPFLLAGVAIGFVETAEHAAVAAQAPEEIRGSAFGLLAAINPLETWPHPRSPGSSGRSCHPRPPSTIS